MSLHFLAVFAISTQLETSRSQCLRALASATGETTRWPMTTCKQSILPQENRCFWIQPTNESTVQAR